MNPLYPIGENNQPNIRLNSSPIFLKKELKMTKQKSVSQPKDYTTKADKSFKMRFETRKFFLPLFYVNVNEDNITF